jgi:multidrug efflux pump subunit AcrA (membrane-fusion protein)
MKSLTLVFVCLFPVILHAQGTPDTGNSKLWEMRKKVQQRGTQRAGSYLEQMNESLASGDSAGAEEALKSAIAQGSMTQAQIDESRGQIDGLVSRQQQAMVAEARAAREEEARQAEARQAEAMQLAADQAAQERAAQTTETSGTSGRSSMSFGATFGGDSATSEPANTETELDRFRSHWRGRTALFTVTHDNGGTGLDGTSLVVRDNDTGKKFKVHYNMGFSEGLFDADVRSAVGYTVSIRFGDDGFPSSIKNPENGRGTQTSSGGSWVVDGFGW